MFLIKNMRIMHLQTIKFFVNNAFHQISINAIEISTDIKKKSISFKWILQKNEHHFFFLLNKTF